MTLAGCFAEKLCRRLGQRVIEWSLIDEFDEALIEVRRPLRVVELNGAGLAALGATAAVASGPYRASRAWARALHGHPDAPEGIRYRSRHDDSELCVGLFDRCPGIERVLAAARGLPPWMLLDLLTSPQDELGGHTPLEALGDGEIEDAEAVAAAITAPHD